MSNERITLDDLSVALRKHGATLALQLCPGGSKCKVTIEWVTRPAQMGGSSAGQPGTPRTRELKFTGSLEDVIDTITAWAQEELPVTYYPAINVGTLNNDGDKKNGGE